jgi:single-stranded-DNA-specific exonuclease
LAELKQRLAVHAEQRLGAREPAQTLRIHAELPLNRITTVVAGWLRRLEPFGHGNPEPIFAARRARVAAAPRVMKDRHIRLELSQEPAQSPHAAGRVRAVGWDWAARCMDLQLCEGSLIDVAYRVRENDHPDFGGIEIEIAGVRISDE